MSINEFILNEPSPKWFGALGHAVGKGPQLAHGEPTAAPDSFGEVMLAGRQREVIRRLTPAIGRQHHRLPARHAAAEAVVRGVNMAGTAKVASA